MTTQAPGPSSAATSLALTVAAEKTQLAHGVSHALSVLVSLKAPESLPTERAPLEIVAVVDRSGSMSGSKMNAMKEALGFLVSHGLQKDDRFSIVAFDNTVDLRLPVLTMDAAGKKKALETVGALTTGGATNLSGGLLKGIDVLSQASGGSSTASKAVLLFTDGIANNGITDSAGIVTAAQGAMATSPMTVFTFGFGSDHSESLLRSLAEDTNGLYYYVSKSEDIPVSFADCLGGLVSVVAQNAVLRIEGLDGSTVTKAHCHYKREPTGSESALALQLGDIYAEDEKDVLLTVQLPPLDGARPAGTPALRVSLRYFSVAESKIAEATADLEIARPAETPAGQAQPTRLAEQRERIAVSEAMSEASELADRGRIEEGRLMLQKAWQMAEASDARESPAVRNIVADAKRAEEGYSDVSSYRAYGSKMSKMSAMSHQMQRSSHCSGQAYERKSKMAMKSAFSASSSISAPATAPPRVMQQAPVPPMPPSTKAKKKPAAMFRLPTLGSLRSSSVDMMEE